MRCPLGMLASFAATHALSCTAHGPALETGALQQSSKPILQTPKHSLELTKVVSAQASHPSPSSTCCLRKTNKPSHHRIVRMKRKREVHAAQALPPCCSLVRRRPSSAVASGCCLAADRAKHAHERCVKSPRRAVPVYLQTAGLSIDVPRRSIYSTGHPRLGSSAATPGACLSTCAGLAGTTAASPSGSVGTYTQKTRPRRRGLLLAEPPG